MRDYQTLFRKGGYIFPVSIVYIRWMLRGNRATSLWSDVYHLESVGCCC